MRFLLFATVAMLLWTGDLCAQTLSQTIRGNVKDLDSKESLIGVTLFRPLWGQKAK